jgi:hypothetical protein
MIRIEEVVCAVQLVLIGEKGFADGRPHCRVLAALP